MDSIEHTLLAVICMMSAYQVGLLLGKRAMARELSQVTLDVYGGDEIVFTNNGIYIYDEDSGVEFKLTPKETTTMDDHMGEDDYE